MLERMFKGRSLEHGVCKRAHILLFRGELGHEDDSVALYAAKTSAKTARQYQSLLRTLTSHWKMPFGKLDRGWLILLTDTEYRAAVAGATVRQDCAASDHGEVAMALHSVGEASGASCTTADKTRGRPRDTPLAGRWL